nr:MAG TPA: hypothetical protein [Caudoviricetes sp.]
MRYSDPTARFLILHKIPRSYQYEPSHPRKYHLMDGRENQVPGR